MVVVLDLFSRPIVGQTMQSSMTSRPIAKSKSFFSSMKTERRARKVCRAREQARDGVLDHIEWFLPAGIRRTTTSAPSSSTKRKMLRSVSTGPAAAHRS